MNQMDEVQKIIEQLATKIEALREELERRPKRMDDVSELIKKTRKVQGLTQHELVDLAGIGSATLKRIESGNKNVTFSNLLNLLDALGINLWIG